MIRKRTLRGAFFGSVLFHFFCKKNHLTPKVNKLLSDTYTREIKHIYAKGGAVCV